MSDGRPHTPGKWRPSLALIIGLVLATVLALPLVGLFFFRFYENQLIQRTEAELIGQSAVLAAVAAQMAGEAPELPLGAERPRAPPGRAPDEPYDPIEPRLDLAQGPILGRRPDALPSAKPADPAFLEIGRRLGPILVQAQASTLAGFRILDPRGVVIAGREEVGLSLAHVPEVAAALRGEVRSVLRTRISRHPPPPVYSVSRGTSVRVFTAMPIVVGDRLAGVVYASRTPSNVVKQLYEERGKLALAAAAILAVTALIGLLFSRFVTHPVHQLIRRTAEIGRGDRSAIKPLERHGTREFAQLSESFLAMAASLQERSDYLRTFAAHVSHELKSPLTAIRGAAELMLDAAPGSMTEEERRRFLGNILADAGRLAALVNRLRELARADNPPIEGETNLGAAAAALRTAQPGLAIRLDGDPALRLPLSEENAGIVLGHLADNAARHGAGTLTLSARRDAAGLALLVRDDGGGIAPGNRARIFDTFFTTRREEGGTGMGLAIVRSLVERHGGTIALDEETGDGAAFRIRLP
ncbi:sensor histidine kinase [Enterovirga rhinocerotis]|uniref:histidine kinase n=1 Tax=Enterovirga rhinocerotis TaxID=1339210 RepID=A0A4R7BYK8_9HYPH|nr:HAMP domain-containing sensor histidine kinase [Enterovirga rhinocerotis]TDR89835.1 signal transduction histidine kinase [Enterovirga rhinocerotis]